MSTQKALVFSGGGSKGAYAVGVLTFLKDHRPEWFADGRFTATGYFGTSTGALIAPLAALGEVALLTEFYTNTQQSDLLVPQDGATILRRGCLFDSTGLDTLVDTVYTPVRFGLLTDPAIRVGVTATCLQTGDLLIATTRPLPDRLPQYRTRTLGSRNDLVDAVRASAHQPFFMRPVRFQSDPPQPPRFYVDGGVREYAAIQVALDAGADEVLAILLSPETPPPDDTLSTTDLISVLQRTIDIFSEDVNLNDVRVPDLISRGTNYWLAVRANLFAAGLPPAQVEALLSPPNAPRPMAYAGPTKIHVIRPATPLGGGPGGLTFDPVEMKQMFARGVADATAYFRQLDQNGGIPPATLT